MAVSYRVPALAAHHAGDRSRIFLGFARLAFGVPFRGSLWQLALLCVLTSLAFSALGLLVSSRAQHHGSRLRPHEPGHASHVDIVRSLLLRHALPRRHSTHGARPAPYRRHRRPAREHAPGHRPGTHARPHRSPARLAGRALRRIRPHLPLEIALSPKESAPPASPPA